MPPPLPPPPPRCLQLGPDGLPNLGGSGGGDSGDCCIQ